MTKRKIILAALALCVMACGKKESQSETIIFDKPITAGQNPYVIDNVIELETSDNSLFGYITKLDILDDKIYVLDMDTNKGLYVFNMDGKFLGRIGNAGNGPGEYIIPLSFTIDKDSNSIYIFDNAKQQVLKYDSENFEFIGSYKTPFYFIEAEYLNNGTFVFYVPGGMTQNDFDEHIAFSDDRFNIIRKESKKQIRTIHGFSSIRYVYKDTKGNCNFFLPNEGILYQIKPDSIDVRYRFKGHINFAPDDFFIRDEDSIDFFERLMSSNYIRDYRILETSDQLLFGYNQQKKRFAGVFDKNTDKKTLFGITDIKDNMNLNDYTLPLCVYNDKFVSVEYHDDRNPTVVLYKFAN